MQAFAVMTRPPDRPNPAVGGPWQSGGNRPTP